MDSWYRILRLKYGISGNRPEEHVAVRKWPIFGIKVHPRVPICHFGDWPHDQTPVLSHFEPAVRSESDSLRTFVGGHATDPSRSRHPPHTPQHHSVHTELKNSAHSESRSHVLGFNSGK